MISLLLPNYLRANRKRLALSQDDVAFLLGTQSGAKVCRYERFVREPSLETAFAYEAIFRKPVRELFSGLYQKVERKVAARAKLLTYKKDSRRPNRQTAHKRQSLMDIAALHSKKPLDPE
jgi:transcriptional regulator with XRE-family HTH domain